MRNLNCKILYLLVLNLKTIFTFSGILSNFDESDVDEVSGSIRISTRNRRSVDGVIHPDHYDLSLSASGKEVHLFLKRNDRITYSVPTVLLKDGKKSFEQTNVSQDGVFYQDTEAGGSFLVYFKGNSSSRMYGVFQSSGGEYLLESNATLTISPERHSLHTFRLQKLKPKKNNYDVIKSDIKFQSTRLINRIKSRRQKRASGSYSVELLIAVDYAIYQRWYLKSTGSTASQKDSDALASIRQFYAFVINGMDAMYKNIQTTSFSINILFAGIIIAKTPNDAPWTESFKITSVYPNQVPANNVLSSFRSWITSQSYLPGHDHAMMFTGYEMIIGGSTSISGYASTDAMCSSFSQSIVEDNFNFIFITIAAHELGHSLGARHDGSQNFCSETDAYIMTPTTEPQLSSATASNPWKFSTCSTTYFNNFINTLPTDNCMTRVSTSFDPTALATEMSLLPGQLYDADQQCQNIAGPGSYLCRQQYNGDYSSICNVLWCSVIDNPQFCRSYVAGDGTLCGNKKWCISGVCTSSSSAPIGSDTCLYGDQIGTVFQNGWTCAQMYGLAPYNCVNVETRCCGSCSPTTQAPTTTPTTAKPTTQAPTTPKPNTATTTPTTTTKTPTTTTPTTTTPTTTTPTTTTPTTATPTTTTSTMTTLTTSTTTPTTTTTTTTPTTTSTSPTTIKPTTNSPTTTTFSKPSTLTTSSQPSTTTGTKITTTNSLLEQKYIYIIAAGAVVILIVFIILICMCCCRKTTSQTTNNLSYFRHTRPATGYINRGMVPDDVVRKPEPKVQKKYNNINHV